MANKPHTGHLPEDNSWMSVFLLHQRLDDLLSWCRYPHPEPLSEGWLESVKEGIHAAIEQSLRDVQGNESLAEKLRDTKRLAFRLATQITNCPKLSTVPRREWTVPDDCISFDKLSKLNEEFGELAKIPKSFRSPGRETALGPSEQRETDRQQTTDSPDLVISAMIAALAREADRHPPTDSPAQEAVASPSETAAENAKAQKRLRMQAAFGNPMAAMALAMLAVQDNLISNAFQKIENANQPCLELPSPPEQREVDQDQTTGSPAQEAVASPSEPETIQGVSNTKRTPVHPDRDKLIVEYLKTTGSPKDISRLLKKNHNINMTAGAISKVKNRKRPKKDREDN